MSRPVNVPVVMMKTFSPVLPKGLDYVVRGFRRESAEKPRVKRLPITSPLLRMIHAVWSAKPPGCSILSRIFAGR